MRHVVIGVLSFLIAASLFAQGNLAVSGIRKGKASPPSENEDNQPDPPPPVMVVSALFP
jgi:hypothetical protein